MHDDISTIQKGSPPRKDHLTDRDANIVAKAALLPVFGRKLHIGAVPAIWTISRSRAREDKGGWREPAAFIFKPEPKSRG